MFQERTFACGDFTLKGAIGPANGRPLIFLHGVTRCWQDFMTLMPAVAPRWSTCAIDFRGHGGSDRAKGYRVVDHLADAMAFMTAHVKEPAVIYGHSLGAHVAAGIAAQARERVIALILEDPPAEPLLVNIRKNVFNTLFMVLRAFAGDVRPIGEIARDLGSYLMPMPNAANKAGPQRDPVSIRFMAKSLKTCDPENLTTVLEARWLDGFDMESVYKQIRCPVMLFRGDEAAGGMLPKSEGDKLMRCLADGTLVEWAGTGHLIHWMQTDAVARYVTGFLESLP
jgi:pimeloyl-ACP methyl ester carboxylesterase